jgi:enterochelin esterase-like enzyme
MHDNDRYPCLYLLHGYGGNETSWLKRIAVNSILDSLILKKTLPPVVVVMPYGYNSYYINSYDNECRYEDYFINELIPYIEKSYPVDTAKKMYAIAGMSMGGFGSVILTTKHPEQFGTTIAISAAVRNDDILKEMSSAKYCHFLAPIFGVQSQEEDRITQHWINNNPYHIIDSSNSTKLQSTNWYVDCGQQDYLFDANVALHNHFTKYNINHVYQVHPGEHNWDYWKKSFIRAMVYWGEILEEIISKQINDRGSE